MNRYYVIAMIYNSELERRERVIIGEFDRYINAELFRTAYNEHYKANAKVFTEHQMLNA